MRKYACIHVCTLASKHMYASLDLCCDDACKLCLRAWHEYITMTTLISTHTHALSLSLFSLFSLTSSSSLPPPSGQLCVCIYTYTYIYIYTHIIYPFPLCSHTARRTCALTLSSSLPPPFDQQRDLQCPYQPPAHTHTILVIYLCMYVCAYVFVSIYILLVSMAALLW
jgi:hypothetical protein